MNTLTETRLRPEIVVWTLGGDEMHTAYGTNCTGILGQDGVLLVDPLIAPTHARLIEVALRRLTAAPVRFVVLTHHHTDHTLGASWFAAQGAVVVAHRLCRERMAAEHPALIEARRNRPETSNLFAAAVLVSPSVTFDEGLTFYLGGLEVEVWHPGWAHTPGDAFLYVPSARVAVCGDLLFCGYHYNYEHASLSGARRGLDALRALDAEAFIPGHGPVSGPEAIEHQAAYHDVVEAIVREMAANGDADAAAAAALRARFPDHRLGIVIPTAIARLREQLAR